MSLIFHNVFLANSFIGVSDCCTETHGRHSVFHWPSRQQTRPFVQRRQNIYKVTHCNLCCVHLLSDWLPTSLPRQMDCFQNALDLLHVSIWESESQRKCLEKYKRGKVQTWQKLQDVWPHLVSVAFKLPTSHIGITVWSPFRDGRFTSAVFCHLVFGCRRTMLEQSNSNSVIRQNKP